VNNWKVLKMKIRRTRDIYEHQTQNRLEA
jgi:hypothetical protein